MEDLEIRLKRVGNGVICDVYEDGQKIDTFVGTGKWNIYPKIGEYLFQENSSKLKKIKSKPRSKRKL